MPGINCWDEFKNAYNYKGTNPVIVHPPCAQWSRLKNFAIENDYTKSLAHFCFQRVLDNGGIFEHPAGSSFFREVGIQNKIISIDQHWFGFPARKRTYLYFHKCEPIQLPLNFNAIENNVAGLHSSKRSTTTINFAEYLIACIRNK